jgi:hypothetical protein
MAQSLSLDEKKLRRYSNREDFASKISNPGRVSCHIVDRAMLGETERGEKFCQEWLSKLCARVIDSYLS